MCLFFSNMTRRVTLTKIRLYKYFSPSRFRSYKMTKKSEIKPDKTKYVLLVIRKLNHLFLELVFYSLFQLPSSMGSPTSCCNQTQTSPNLNVHQLPALIHSLSRKTSHAAYGSQESRQVRHTQSAKDLVNHRTGNTITLKDFDIVKKVGTGAHGLVVAGYRKNSEDKVDRKMYAIKQMKKSQIRRNGLSDNIKLEKEIMSKPASPFITQLCCAFANHQSYFLAMEYAQKGDIFEVIHPKNKTKDDAHFLEEGTIRFILGCVIMGLEYLHSKNIIYQDMKPENLLLFSDGYVKITDFGLSEKITSSLHKQMFVGTAEYFAPEMLFGEKYDKSIDMWALGVLAFQLANGRLPFPYDDIGNQEQYIQLIKSGVKGWSWRNDKVSDNLKDFVGKLLKYEPEKRLGTKGWKQIKEHNFFTSVHFDWQALKHKKMTSPLRDFVPQINIKTQERVDLNIGASHMGTDEDQDSQIVQNWSIDLQSR